MLNVFITSILTKTNVECVFITLVFPKTDVIKTLSTSVLDQPMLFFFVQKLKIIIIIVIFKL